MVFSPYDTTAYVIDNQIAYTMLRVPHAERSQSETCLKNGQIFMRALANAGVPITHVLTSLTDRQLQRTINPDISDISQLDQITSSDFELYKQSRIPVLWSSQTHQIKPYQEGMSIDTSHEFIRNFDPAYSIKFTQAKIYFKDFDSACCNQANYKGLNTNPQARYGIYMGRFLEACAITTAIDDLVNNPHKQGSIVVDATFTPLTSLTKQLLNEPNQTMRQNIVATALEDRLAMHNYANKLSKVKNRLFYHTSQEILTILPDQQITYPTLAQSTLPARHYGV